MKNLLTIGLSLLVFCTIVQGDWTFTTINPAGSTGDMIHNSGIAWRPQGDYALIAGTNGLYRYDYPSAVFTWDYHPGETMYRAAWSPDGSYAILTGSTHIYRYEHSATGFGTLTEIAGSEIQGYGSYTTTFYDVEFNPGDPQDLPYIAANREDGTGDNQIVIYRYDPFASPQVYWDYTGGTTTVSNQNFQPRAISFQANGDYFVLVNYWGDWIQGFFTYDPDQSTFPKNPNGTMQFKNVPMGNATAIAIRPVSDTIADPVLIVKGTGQPHCFIDQGLPASWAEHDTGAPWHTAIIDGGEASWSYDGSRCIVTERQEWSPYHRVMVFDGNGDSVTNGMPIDSPGFQNETDVRLFAVSWHPHQPFGIMGGSQRWLFSFSTNTVPTPQATLGPTFTPTSPPTPTPLPLQLPSASPGSLIIVLFCLGFMLMKRRKRL